MAKSAVTPAVGEVKLVSKVYADAVGAAGKVYVAVTTLTAWPWVSIATTVVAGKVPPKANCAGVVVACDDDTASWFIVITAGLEPLIAVSITVPPAISIT